MFKSLRRWCNNKVNVKKFIKKSGSGDKQYDTTIRVYDCLRIGEVRQIRNKKGQDYVSTSQFYIPSEFEITVDDMIEESGNYFEIQLITIYNDGNTGLPSLRTVFL